MATVKLAVLRHTKAKDGSYKIRISIGHKSETHYIVTRYRVQSLANFVNGVVVNQPDAHYINVKLRSLLNDYDSRLDAIPNLGDLSCEQLRDMLRDMRPMTGTATMRQMADEYITLLRKEGRTSYARIIQFAVAKFLRYMNGDVMLSQLNTITIDNYYHYLLSQGLSAAYTNICMVNVRIIVNRAIQMQQVRYDVHPFQYYHCQQGDPRELDIPVEDMRKFVGYDAGSRGHQQAADFFLLSYYLGGMNLKDMVAYDFRGYKDKPILSYIRLKTSTKKRGNRTVEFTIQPEAFPIIDRWMNPKTGHLIDVKPEKYASRLKYIDLCLEHIAERLHINHRLSFYSARKSFVQHGFELGIPLETLEYCIGQSMKSNRPIYNYVKIMRQHADVAIRQILDNMMSGGTIR
jgi:site-specific recombinase XerD